MSQDVGLRERKKQRTRELIADTARRLFIERGFAAVPVSEIAEVAEVSQATVFNYFPTKEDLVYARLEEFEQEMLSSISGRAPGEAVLDAFGRFILTPRGLLSNNDPNATERLAAIARVITESPALLAREQQIYAAYTRALARLLADETGKDHDSLEPWLVAHTLVGLHQTLVDFTRKQVLDGVRNPALSRRVRRQSERALELLAHGLGDYGLRGNPTT